MIKDSAILVSTTIDHTEIDNTDSYSRPKTDPEMASLEAAAMAKSELAFLNAGRSIDWIQRPASDFIRAIDLALMAGAFMAARTLSKQGADRYPENAELQQMAHVLAPPKVTVSQGKPTRTWRADRDWLKSNWDAYKGKWVALLNGELLGAADSFDTLIQQVGDTRNTQILVTPIW